MSLTVGTRGFRVLDELLFACEIVEVAADGATLSVCFLDTNTIEHDVEVDEFQAESSVDGESTLDPPPPDRLLLSVRDGSSILGVVVRFLDQIHWLASLIRVSRGWHDALLTSELWRTVRAPLWTRHTHRLLGVRLDSGDQSVGAVAETLVLDGSDVTNDQVLAAVGNCPRLQVLSLQRCRVSFMVVYEILRLSRERCSAGGPHIEALDIWLCRTISPSFVAQLQGQTQHTRKTSTDGEKKPLRIDGPGFYFVDISCEAFEALERIQASVAGWNPTMLKVLWLPEHQLLERLEAGEASTWALFHRHAPLLKTAALSEMTPLVRFNEILSNYPRVSSTRSEPLSVCVGIPVSTSDELARLIDQYESAGVARCLHATVTTLGETTKPETIHTAEDPLETQAKRVFAMLRQTTEQLQSQVDQLERQVAVMAAAKASAERECKHAQRELRRVSQEADRALLSLATSTDLSPQTPEPESAKDAEVRPGALPAPPQNGIITTKPEDTHLPPMPGSDVIARIANDLDLRFFAILDGFVGDSLSFQVRCDVELMYRASRAAEVELPEQPATHSPLSIPPLPFAMTHTDSDARFTLGELAGGSTGRNLRYQMAHVRGDYILWLDEHDTFCPPSIRLVLRLLDRLILEQLASESHELSMSALLRKKAMVTCYPSKAKARYTRHCDNPNRNGRKLTAILYLNADWDPLIQGGELVLYGASSATATRVAPSMDRLLLFFSDTRVPHEVASCLDAERDRFAMTVWYLDYDEYMHAQVFGSARSDQGEAAERRCIEQEMEKLNATSA